ncbi:hypothetical protein TRFO_10588 [Tritrichomonas foetus]|uniref:Outer dense fiber protein 3 n=1 Tax=Tritrichomonas foetus TaxID=1144522 RepID=A0A1J4J9S9_9EUKA|nr:hypothetical protein TRFO_10588 [Tritrichomonas foetus]|eukprot:OHS95425.1 hypothetical protein TRFO_10588 [Tritrichomonas foetus]
MDPWERAECIAHIPKSMANASPGPAHYNVKRKFNGKQCPPIKMKGRHSITSHLVDAPYYNLPSTIGKVTAIGLHGRTELRASAETPGPTYIPPSFGSGARKISFPAPQSSLKKRVPKSDGAASSLSRRRNPDETPGPGPGTYVIRDKSFEANGKMGYTIKGSHDFHYANTSSPGPGAYAPKFTAVLPSVPKIGFHDRPKEKDPAVTPGYRELGSTLTGPSFTMKARATDDINVI